MEQITPPKAGDDVRDLWKSVAAVVKVCNNLNNVEVNLKGSKNRLIMADGKITLELDFGSLSVQKIAFCENNVAGSRLAFIGDFVPDAASS